jgi:hypothetical protein
VAWNKLKSLFVVTEGQPTTLSAEDSAVIEAALAQTPEAAPAELPPDTDRSKLSGTIDFQGLYDQAGIPNTDEVEALEKFLVELDHDLPQASKLSSAKAFLKAIGKSSTDVLTDAARKIRVVRAVADSKSADSQRAITTEQAAIDTLQKQIDDHRAAIEAAKRDLESVKAQCTTEESRLQGARMFFGVMDQLVDDPKPAAPPKR